MWPLLSHSAGAQKTSDASDFSGVDQFWNVATTLRQGREPTDSAWDQLFATPGYAALQARERRRAALTNAFRAAFSPDSTAFRDSILRTNGWTARVIQHVSPLLGRRDELTAAEARFRATNIIRQAALRAQTILPSGSVDRYGVPNVAFIFFLPDGRGYPGLIVADLAYVASRPDPIPFFAHEAVHFYFAQVSRGAAGGPIKAEPAGVDALLSLFTKLQEESYGDQFDKVDAVTIDSASLVRRYADTSWVSYLLGYRAEYDSARYRLRMLSNALDSMADRPAAMKGKSDTLTASLPMEGRPLGMFMTRAIRAHLGDARLASLVGDPLGWALAYDEAAQAPSCDCPRISSPALTFLIGLRDLNGRGPPERPRHASPLTSGVTAQSAAGDWPTYGRDAGGGRFSPLASITRENVHLLREAWRFSTGPNSIEATTNPAEGNTPNFEATPIVVDGRMYLSTPLGRVFALDPSNGAVLWSFDAKVDTRGNYGDNANRGVATWLDIEAAESGQCRRRIFLATIDARLIALDARDGQPCTDFGRRGVIDLTADLRNPPEYLGEYEETSPPTVVNGVVVVGSGIADNNRLDAPSGVVRGFDVRTGRLRWSWEPVPQDSRDSAWVTWEPPQAHRVGAANAWSVMSSDPGNDLVFVPTGSASVDYYGGERLGSNLYANSIVALRASTGHKVWHFQLVHHDLWDYDVASPPLLTTLIRNGRQVPVVIQTGKTAQVFVLDRLTGAPIFPVDERPVPRSHVPGEKSSETQPFSAGLPSLVAAKAWLDSAFGLSISDRNVCKTRMSQLRYEGPFTPPSLEGSMYSPSQIGGAQWGGLVYDPQRSIIVLPVNRLANAVQLIPRAKYDSTHDEPGWQYTAMTGTPYVLRRQILTGGHGLPCTQPPFSTLVAISLRTRRKVWEIPLGDTRLALRIAGDSTAVDSRWGTTVMGGPIATAGGIVFIAGTSDNLLRGIDVDTGAELWRGSLPGRGKATPMTYYSAVTKKQYVVVAAGGGNLRGKGATIVAFALP